MNNSEKLIAIMALHKVLEIPLMEAKKNPKWFSTNRRKR